MLLDPFEWRSHFAITERHVYLDHASLGPLPIDAIEAMQVSLRAHGANASVIFDQLIEEVDRCRNAFAGFIGADADELCLTPSTGAGFNTIVNGLAWRPGDAVVVPKIEFPAIALPLRNLEANGLTVRRVACADGYVREEHILEACDGRTRMVAVSWVQFSSGQRLDLAMLGEACRKRGILFVVDGMQGIGALQMDLRDLPIDALVTQSFKWLLAPQGVGWLYVRRELMDMLRPTQVGQRSVLPQDSYVYRSLDLKHDAGRFECGMPNLHGVVGARASVELLRQIGIENITGAVLGLVERLIEGLRSKGYVIRGNGEINRARSGIVSIRHPEHDSESCLRRLREAGVVASVREGALRLSPHFYNTADEIDCALDALP